MAYTFQLNLVAPPIKIFGQQDKAREKIKQDETNVLVICLNCKMYLAKFKNI